MVDYTNRNSAAAATGTTTMVDQGLRSYMMKVYNYMTGGLLLTAAVAWFTASSETMLQLLFSGPQAYLVMFAALVFSLFMAFGLHKMSESKAQMLFWAFCGVMGLSLSTILLAYTGASVARTFLISAVMFGGMSLYGYTTKRDLSGFGSFLMMGFWGLFVGFIINMFLGSTQFDMILSAIGVLIFTGLAAYSNQQIKEMYYMVGEQERGKMAVLGAYTLYITFINLMMMLLRFVGERR